MSVIGAFGNKVFEVSQNKIYTFSGLTISEKLNVEMQETEGGKPATYIKGLGEMDITFEILLLSRFCDVDNEIDYWLLKMRSKVPEYLTIGKKAYGTNKHLLVDVQVNDVLIAADGTKTRAKVHLAFKEWTKAGYKKDDKSTSGGTTPTTTTTPAQNPQQSKQVSEQTAKLKKVGELEKQKLLGSIEYVNKNTTTIDNTEYYVDGDKYYPTSYLITAKADGGRSSVKAFPKGTPIYSKGSSIGGGSGFSGGGTGGGSRGGTGGGSR